MSLLSICQEVTAVTGWPILQSVASNATDGTAKQIFAIAKVELRTLSQSKDWPQLEVDFDFVTVPGQDVYPLPADARVVVGNSAYDTSQYYPLRGSVGTVEWNARRYGMLANIWCTTFKIIYIEGVPALKLDTVPQDERSVTVMYRSKYYAISADTSDPIETYANDSDTSRIPEQCVAMGLMWRFRRAKGLDFSVELADYNSEIASQFSQYKSQADIPVGRRWLTWNIDWPLTSGYVPDTGFGV